MGREFYALTTPCQHTLSRRPQFLACCLSYTKAYSLLGLSLWKVPDLGGDPQPCHVMGSRFISALSDYSVGNVKTAPPGLKSVSQPVSYTTLDLHGPITTTITGITHDEPRGRLAPRLVADGPQSITTQANRNDRGLTEIAELDCVTVRESLMEQPRMWWSARQKRPRHSSWLDGTCRVSPSTCTRLTLGVLEASRTVERH